jgi:hypothetical protein
MAVPLYDTDLADITLAESTSDGGTWTAIGGGNITLGAGPDFAMQGTNCVDARISNTDKGPGVPAGTQTLGASDHVFTWVFMATPGLTATLQNGGVTVAIGNSVSALVKYHVEGNDTFGAAGRVARCYPIRPVNSANTSAPNYRTLLGSPSGVTSFFGATANISGTVRGSNLGVDAIRRGTGVYITAGDSGTPATFSGAATENDLIANRWGVISSIAGSSYELQGRFVVGQNTAGTPTAAYFVDSNKNVLLTDTPHAQSDFTQIIIDHASTTFNLTNINIEAGGTTNPGKLVFNNASTTSALDNCGFVKLGETVLRAGVTATNSAWRQCGRITLNGATISGSAIRNSTATTALLVGSSVSTLSNTSFVSAGTGHAIEITGGTEHTLNGLTFTGYDAGSTGSPVTTTNTGKEMIFVNIGSGTTVTLNADVALSVRSAGATVNVVAGQKTLSVTNVVSGSDIVILSAGTTTVLASNDGATNPVTSFDYSYTYAPSTLVDIAVYLAGYVPYIVRNYLLPANGGSVQVAQVVDRNYTP